MESYEHALLLFSTKVVSPSVSQDPLNERLNSLLHSLIVKSDYIGILKTYSHHFQFSAEQAELSITSTTPSSSITDEEAFSSSSSTARKLELLIYGIAALQAFLQANWTGPAVELDPKDLFLSNDAHSAAPTSTATTSSTSQNGNPAWTEASLNAEFIEQLSLAGEPAYHLAKKAGFLLLAKIIFQSSILAGVSDDTQALPSLDVWQLRLGLINLRLLDTPVSLPDSLLSGVIAYTSNLSTSSTTSESDSTILDLRASLLLLQGLYHSQFIHVSTSATKISNEYFYAAAKTSGLKYELTGRLGKRTKFQIDEKTQLVVLAKSRDGREDGWTPRETMALKPEVEQAMNGQSDKQDNSTLAVSIQITNANGASSDKPKAVLLNDDTLLERTRFASTADDISTSSVDALSNIDPNHQPILHPLDECILLALSLVITNNSPSHGLTTLEIQSFVSRVLEDGSQNWSIYSMALLLRSRLEANRSRTVERGLLQIQSLVDQLKLESITKPEDAYDLNLEKGATPYERLKYFYQLSLPSTWELEKELATRYLGLGVVRSAMEIFTRLEMWEDVARCHSAVGDDKKAVQIVRDLLEEKILESESTMSTRRKHATPATPSEDLDEGIAKPAVLSLGQKIKLWCLLGDLEQNAEHYRTAWSISKETNSRAMQSLGKTYFMSGDYKNAQECLIKALSINPLQGKMWFILGCAAMRNEDWQEAEKAFRRCTSIDDDDGEAWNNLATVILKQIDLSPVSNASTTTASAEADDIKEKVYDNKRLAFTCLRQAIRYSYDSWRIWVNYMLVAMDVGELMEACRALARLAEMRAEKDGTNAVDLEVLDKLVQVVVKDAANVKTGDSTVTIDAEGKPSFLSQAFPLDQC
jgi:tetratricopeptide (TPR) repeat protein